MRVDFDREGYERYLPVIYRAQAGCGDFLVRFLGLFESFLGEVEDEISGLPALFDTAAARKEFLPWLAGWLGLALDENWSEQKKREAIAGAFASYARRGTARGLRERLWTLAGVNAVIEEPIQHAAWWSLPGQAEACCSSCGDHASSGSLSWEGTENSRLGWSTMLAPAQASGAVLGATAVLDQSHLIPAEDFGAPLFSDLAFQFSVLIYQSDVVCAERMARLKAVLEQERPAHTQYQLCVIRPEMRVGFQGRIGIDTVVAGERPSFGLGAGKLGEETTLGGAPSPHIGESRLGMQLHVG
jgi:phage tail-like protein